MSHERVFQFDVDAEIDRHFDDSSHSHGAEPSVVILMGGVASGKTTIRRQRYSTGHVLVDAAELFAGLSRGARVDFPGPLAQALDVIGPLIARRAIAERRHIVTELIGAAFEPTKALIEAMRAIGYRVAVQAITCEIEEAILRNVARGHDNISSYHAEHYQRRWLHDAAVAARTLMLATCCLVGGAPRAAQAQRPLNLDFERASVAYADRPWGWTFGWSAFAGGPTASFTLDSAVHHDGRRSLRIQLPDSTPNASPQAIMLQLPPEFFRGREVSVTGWAKTGTLQGKALLTLEAWKDRAFAAADTAWADPAVAGAGIHDWTQHDVRVHVPDDPAVHSVVITLGLEGRGTVWFDALTLSVDDVQQAALPGAASPATEAELAWLQRYAAPLRTFRAPVDGSPDDTDLRLVGDIVGTTRVLGLGESTHGTSEFFQVKHRLLEYLVRKLGFGVFAIEANQVAVEQVNAYVQGGRGTARDAMRVMFRVWNTDEMLALVEWMRAYNTTHPTRRVRFVGYDMQDQRTPADTLRAFLAREEPALLEGFDALTGEYRAQSASATPLIADSIRIRWARQAETLWDVVSARRPTWLARASTHADTLAAEWAVQAANLFRQAARFNVALTSPERDSLMAANLDWALRALTPDSRAVVWAHDVHVSHGGDSALSFNAGAQMGAHIRRYGYDYRSLTLLTYDGSYSATRSFSDHRMIEADAFPAPPGSVEEALHRLKRPEPTVGWVVDLRPARTDDGGDWLRRPRPIRHIGYAAYDYGFEFNAVLPLEFDGVVFIDHTTGSHLLR